MTQYATQRQNLTKVVNQYIIAAIDGSGYDKELSTDKEKLQFVAECYKKEYSFRENLIRYKTHQNCFANWLMGLPSSFNVDFENYRIIELAKEWGSLKKDADDMAEDKILDAWFNFIASKTISLMSKHGITIW